MPVELIILPALLFLAAPLLLILLRLTRPRFAYYWLVSVFTALVALPLLWFSRLQSPALFSPLELTPGILFPYTPAFILDSISLPYAVSVGTVALAVILTDVARTSETSWQNWAGSLMITGLGLLAVMAGNPLTLALAWAAIDLLELAVLLSQMINRADYERIVIAYAVRAGGIFLLITAAVAAQSTGTALSFTSIPQQTGVYLILAAGLRLGIIPLHLPILQETTLRRGLGTLLRLVPAAAGLILLSRAATAGAPAHLVNILLALIAVTAVYAGASWLGAEDELDGRWFWILGTAALTAAAAVRGNPGASLAWGTSALLSGALLFLSSARQRRILPILWLGLLGFSALPYTPAWQGLFIYSAPFNIWVWPLLLAHILLLAGFARHILRPEPPPYGLEQWIWLIYPLGLLLLPVSHFVLPWWNRPESGAQLFPTLLSSWPGLLAVAVVAGLIIWNPDPPRLSRSTSEILQAILSFQWLYHAFWAVYHFLGRIVSLINLILEGEGGILWTLLLLVLLLSLVIQQFAGG
ncbi:MAG: hypothetical protein GX495_14770 [Chloroflexi bacterium]|nr:hypothetical protein [Chloroflexota bacterium]